jgi:DnaK suppressor protein
MTSDAIDQKALKTIEKQLLKLRSELSTLLQDSEERAQTVELDQTRVGRVSRGDALQQQQMALENRRQYQQQLKLTETALDKISEGEYGICGQCDEWISPERLKARPTALLCIACQSAREDHQTV